MKKKYAEAKTAAEVIIGNGKNILAILEKYEGNEEIAADLEQFLSAINAVYGASHFVEMDMQACIERHGEDHVYWYK